MNYAEQVRADQKAAEEKMQEIQVLVQINEFFERHEELVQCDAAVKIIMEYMADTEISAETLEDALAHTRLAQAIPHQTLLESREKVEAELLAMFEQSSPGTSAHEAAKFKYKETSELREQLAQLKEARAMRAKSPAQLRAEIQAAKPSQEQELPDDITREAILMLWTPETFKFWARKVGMNAITRRINSKRGTGIYRSAL